ncbi:unnamed protein product [Ilex paraguariensis]|uniref:Response regulatory domain-containing protein n=1 Tax=Ilex paraguariensis TaxID=185542 RepID=A0ABC8R319_9AQUA
MWWELDGSRTSTGPSVSKTSYHTFTCNLRVLLVDNDKECLFSTAKMLETSSYKVTAVEHVSTALSMLSEGKEHFDLLLADIDQSPDLDGCKLLCQSIIMEVPAFVMSNNEDTMLARKALENGAFLFLDKPVSMEMLTYLWQHVLRERIRKKKMPEKDKLGEVTDDNGKQNKSKRKIFAEDKGSETNNKTNNSGSKRRERSKTLVDKGQECVSEDNGSDRIRRRPCTEWTEELHGKFMEAVHLLGEGSKISFNSFYKIIS